MVGLIRKFDAKVQPENGSRHDNPQKLKNKVTHW